MLDGFAPQLLTAFTLLPPPTPSASTARRPLRPSHAASWISLAQLRTRKLGFGASTGRACFVNTEYELGGRGKNSSHLYAAGGMV